MFEPQTKLSKIGAEKDFLRTISALERSYTEEKDVELREAYSAQIKELKGRLAGLSNASGKRPHTSTPSTSLKASGEQALLFLYHAVMKRYGEMISEKERKTVGEIKAMVTKDDLTIQSLLQELRPENYDYPKDYQAAAERAFNYVRDEIRNTSGADIGVSFWPTPSEIISERMADDEDKAILLCSLLFTLGDNKAEVVIAELENNTPHAFVMTQLEGRFLFLDPSQAATFSQFSGRKSDIIRSYAYNNSGIRKFLYKFNNSNYEQFLGAETG